MLRSMVHGLRQACSAPKLLALLWLANTLAALPFALMVTHALQEDVGASRVADHLRHGFDTEWLAEYNVRARGVATLFSPLRTGAGVVYDNLDAWLSGGLTHGQPALLALGTVYALVWILLQGGLLARLAAPRERFPLARFLGAGGRYFGRLTQLAALALLLYYGLYRLAAWAFGRLDAAFRDAGTETQLLTRAALLGGAFVLLLHAVRLVFDYAKIVTVVEDQRWSPVAAWQGLRFVVARPLSTFGVYTGMALLTAGFLWLYTVIAPGPGDALVSAVLGFLGAQLFVAGRLLLRVATLGAELSLYRTTGGL